MDYHWPGNVRELRNAIESAAINARGQTIEPADLEQAQRAGHSGAEVGTTDLSPIAVPAAATLDQAERLLIAEHLRRSRTKVEASRALGIGLRTLYSKIRTMNLDRAGADLSLSGGNRTAGST
jgi:DNA-binding NtrC family response regulator